MYIAHGRTVDEDDKWQDVLDQLAYIRAQLGELLRRVPEPRCRMCGLVEGYHTASWGGTDHEFTP